MEGFFSLVLHAHLPFVRHPEHQRSLEESWLYEAITETYVPLLQCAEQWQSQGIRAPIAITLTPTLCSMLLDPLLRERYGSYLEGLLELAEQELHRTLWETGLNELAQFYHRRLTSVHEFYYGKNGNLVQAFKQLQDAGALEIITSAATHAVLPLMLNYPECIRAQVLVARDHYRSCFGREPRGIWLPECAYAPALDSLLKEARLEWFITDTHGLLHAHPKPHFGTFAPLITPGGLAAFGRDHASARQVWSRNEGYPGDPRYRDFYRDIGFDLDLDYLKPHLPAGEQRTFTGIKYHRITGDTRQKEIYQRAAALHAADEHAGHFLEGRRQQITNAAKLLQRPPIVVAPYDAELFGHWWYEGPEFLDAFVRKAFYDQKDFAFATPHEFLEAHPTHQLATPAASSWGEEGYWSMWLNEKTSWIYPHLSVAQERMTELASQAANSAVATPDALKKRAIRQAARELLLAQSSDWPFILRTGTSPEYARGRIQAHLSNFNRLYEQLKTGNLNSEWLKALESTDNIFLDLKVSHWAKRGA